MSNCFKAMVCKSSLPSTYETRKSAYRIGPRASADSPESSCMSRATPGANTHLLQAWIKFVNKLEIDDLELRYTAFTVAGQKGDLKEQCQRLNLTWPINVSWVKATNQKNPGALRNLAIDVVYKSRGCSVFKYVMAMAAISQLWPVTSGAGSQAGHEPGKAIEGSEEQGITCSACNTSLPSALPTISEGGGAGNSAARDGQPLQPVYKEVATPERARLSLQIEKHATSCGCPPAPVWRKPATPS